jgi:hypothetical protein
MVGWVFQWISSVRARFRKRSDLVLELMDTIDGTVAVLRARRDDGNTTPGNAVLVFLQPLHLMSNCCADGL